jgi:DNA-directed RNA polymerase subunit RPC12/RpoP
MLTVYLDGIPLQGDSKSLVVNAMGPLNHTCSYCGGSFIEVRRILIRSSESPAIFFYWCASCGKISRISEEFPIEWHSRIMGKILVTSESV